MKASVRERGKKKIEKMEGDLYGHQRSTGTNFHALVFLPGKDEVWQTCSALFYFFKNSIFLSIYSRSAMGLGSTHTST